MDVEIGRVLEKLRELGLDESTLVVFAVDHGEEFLDHGRMFHGQSVYSELTRVPVILRWPNGLAAGSVVEATTQTIDLMPTLLALSSLDAPDGLQGQSLVPLLMGNETRWQSRPAISEKARTDEGGASPWPAETESHAIVDGGWKLIHNRQRPEGAPEFELFDVESDPLDQRNVADANPEVVSRLAEAIDGWFEMANAARLAPDSAGAEGLSQQQLERLRSLGYIR